MRVEIGNNETIKGVIRFMWECLRRRPDYRSEFEELSKKYPDEVEALNRCRPGAEIKFSYSVGQQLAWFHSRWRIYYAKDYRRNFDDDKDYALFSDNALGISDPLWLLRYRTVLDTLECVDTLMAGERILKDNQTGKVRRVRSYAEALKVVREQELVLANAMKRRESKYGRNMTMTLNIGSYPVNEILSEALEAIQAIKHGIPKRRLRIPDSFELDVYEMCQSDVRTYSQIAKAFTRYGVSSAQRVIGIRNRIERWMERVAPWDFMLMRRP